jgi:Tol biopolymer transport system component
MRRIALIAGLVLVVVAVPALALEPGETVLVNRAPDGTNPPYGTPTLDVSSDGRCVVFVSEGPAFPGANGNLQVYVRDTVANTTTLVSAVPAGGDGGNADSQGPDVTPDCRYVAFDSDATDLTATAVTDRHVYRRDMQTGTTVLVSRATTAGGAPADRGAFSGTISDDGSRIVFATAATNLAADDSDGALHTDLFLREIGSSTTTNVSRNSAGVAANGFRGAGNYPTLSGDGNVLGFYADSDNLSPDDTDGDTQDVFVKNLTTGAVELASRASGATGAAGNSGSGLSELSGDGTRVAFITVATNLGGASSPGQVYVRDLATDATILVSADNAGNPANTADSSSSGDALQMSADGDRVVFNSNATNLPGGGGDGMGFDVFIRDLSSGTTELAAKGSDGTPAGTSLFAAISADGENVAFTTPDGLVADDTDGQNDVYLHRLGPGGTTPTPTPTPAPPAAPGGPAPAPPATSAAVTLRGAAAFARGTANDLYLACTTLDLYLVDVLPAGRRVSVTGAADLRLAGQTADILLDGRRVGRAVIRADGAFAARVAAPSRRRRARARYQARIGSTASQRLRLARRMVATTLTRSGSNLVLRGVVNPPRARRQPAIAVERFLSCRRREAVRVRRVRPDRRGRFAVRIKVPAGAQAVLYRARTKVPARAGRPATKGTFTLPRAANVR